MTNLNYLMIVVLWISIHMALSMKPSSQTSKFNIKESTLDTDLSLHAFTKDLPTKKPSVKHPIITENQEQLKSDLGFAYQSHNGNLPRQPPRLADGGSMLGKYPSFGSGIKRNVPDGSINNEGRFYRADLGKRSPSSKGPLITKVCVQKLKDGDSVPKCSLVDQFRTKEEKKIGSKEHQKIVENKKNKKKYLVLGYQSPNKDFPKQLPRLNNQERMNIQHQSIGSELEPHLNVVPFDELGEHTTYESSMSRQSAQDDWISEVSTSEGLTSHGQMMRNGRCVSEYSPSVRAGIRHIPIEAPSKAQKFVENSEQHSCKLVLGSRYVKKGFNRQSDQLCDEEKMNRRCKSVEEKIENTVAVGKMNNQGGLIRTEYGSEEISSKGQNISELSGYKGSSSDKQEMSDGKFKPKQRPLKRSRPDQNQQIVTKKHNKDFPPDDVQASSMHLNDLVSHFREHGDGHASKSKGKSTKIQEMEHTSAQLIPEIDIQRFELHNPDKVCSAAAVHFTLDLVETLKIKYQNQTKKSSNPTWEAVKEIWTPVILHPFVYFVVSCNPDLRIWMRIKEITITALKVYHKQCIDATSSYNQDKLAQFLLWHTDVIYHIAQLGPKIKSLPEDIRKISLNLTTPGISTLARTVHIIYDDKTFATFMRDSNTRWEMFKRYVTKTFEDDYQKGYPEISTKIKLCGSVWENWITKSHEIREKAQNIQWPQFFNPPTSDIEPILFVKGEFKNGMGVKTDTDVSEFKNTMKIIKTSQSGISGFPSLSIKDFCRGINLFLKEKLHTKPSKLQVKLFSEFLHQDSRDAFYVEFWKHFKVLENENLKASIYKKNRRYKNGT